ncbi:MAG: xanthine dehydrogenase family protein molybdopterin-binding subunit [Actinomycetota bacterium]
MSILGTRVLRSEDPRFLTSGGDYIESIDIPAALHVVYVQSTAAHARITAIDSRDAAAMPGVVAVVTAADVDLADQDVPHTRVPASMARPLLARDQVRFVGELVAAVVAQTRTQAVDAAERVVVDYESLPAVIDVEAARQHDDHVAFVMPSRAGDEIFDGCDVVVEQRIVNQRVAPCPLEVRSAASRWEADGRLTHWACTQNPHFTRNDLADALGVPREQVHVITPDVGGGFGAKHGAYAEEVLVPWLARRLGRPVRWTETRTESMNTLGHGRGQVQIAKLGGTREGALLAYRLQVIQDVGAYPAGATLLPYMTRLMATGVYDIGKVDVDVVSVVTNTTPMEAYRGAGRPEATAAIERMVDLFAAEIGMDPIELRRVNLLPADAFPHTTPTKARYDSGDYAGALDRVLAAAGYERLRAEQAERRTRGDHRQLGIGCSVYVEVTNPGAEEEYGSVEVLPDGRAVARTGTSAHGQGHDTAFAMVVAHHTGIPFDRIEVRHGDTDDIPRGHGTGGSRSLQAGGSAIHGAVEVLIASAGERAAELLEANPDDVVLDATSGRFHVAGTPTIARTWADLAQQSPLQAEFDFEPPGATFPFGAHVALVEVDTETGEARLLRHVACDDAGTIVNPLLVEGQVHGGVGQGAAQALFEAFVYDDDGNPRTANLADYAFPSAAELPSFERVPMETPTPNNPLGAKGIGESGTIGSTAAVHNAVVDALAPFGVHHIDMPCSPERVWRAING